MIQGWRPTSVTTHPASMATKPSGAAITSARSSQGPGNVISGAIPRVAPGGDPVPGDQGDHAEGDADHDLKGDVDDARVGLIARGHSSRPRTTAFGSW